MPAQLYSVTPHPIETILTWVKSKAIAIPEIQRPFVWENAKVRDLLDSLYRGYPVGYLITWRNPNVKLKDGSVSAGKLVLIDGQQRVTALMASLLGINVLNKDYESIRITIAFNPITETFEVSNPAIRNDKEWISDVAELFYPELQMLSLVKNYALSNTSISEDEIFKRIDNVRKISNNQVGVIELSDSIDIETVTEIFIRVNSQGAQLSQADFAMSKIAVNETYGGNMLRKAIDYFCHLSVAPEQFALIRQNDKDFSASEFMQKMSWLAEYNEDLYDPSYTDMLRVAYTSQMGRGELKNLVALLSGRNFETRQFEEEISENSFAFLKTGILSFINEINFKRFIMILKSAGFVSSQLITSQNAVNFAYILYLTGKAEGTPAGELEILVRQWYVMSVLTGRYSGSPETRYDQDIRQIKIEGVSNHVKNVCGATFSDQYWTALLPSQMNTSAARSPYWSTFQAAQAALGTKGFLSSDISCRDLIENRGDAHHLYPKNYMKSREYSRGEYNQIANLVLTQQEINIAIGDKPPIKYFAELAMQCSGRDKKYGNITDLSVLKMNMQSHAVPLELLDSEIPFPEYLELRRIAMAGILKQYFEKMSAVSSND
ncbi:MAG: DUF262 domain-containing protein [Actinobacteria bacterium]|uniref:Unannotated protein n=1 Tax=freshwater metagenome TaxID=449393 RepID=A0A6J7RWE4_9ZZZZ|nr:DUF262 domain-containing protein [Actinomycetota bacterium]